MALAVPLLYQQANLKKMVCNKAKNRPKKRKQGRSPAFFGPRFTRAKAVPLP